MQQTVVVDATVTKDLADVVFSTETTHAYGLFYFFFSVAETTMDVADVDALTIAVSGSLSSYSAVAV